MTAASEDPGGDELSRLRDTVRRLERRVARERTAREEAERIAEAGTRRLLDLNAELDARVAQRTAELADANREVHEASLAKTRLLAAISHQAFTPVHQACGSIELAVTATHDPWAIEQLDRARGALTTIERLFRNLLVVAESDSHGLSLAIGPTDLATTLGEVVEHWRPRAMQQRSLLVADVRDGVGLVVDTDVLRLRHALDELLHNAVRYTIGGIVRLAVDVADDQVVVTVGDEGPGLPVALTDHLFEPFSGERDALGAGLGLGLAAAARIAAALGGRLDRVEQPVGESFRLSLPR